MKGIKMGKVKEYIMERSVDWCCDGIDLCIDCHYHEDTAHYSKRWKPTLETWYNKIIKKAKRIKQKTIKTKIPF